MEYLKFIRSCDKTVLVFILLAVFSSCVKKEKIPFDVVYEVELLTDIPLKLAISYQDSSGLVVFHTRDKKFTKEVFLPTDSIASLFVTVSMDWKDCLDYLNNTPQWLLEEKLKYHVISGKIIHERKTVIESSKNLIMISLTGAECDL